MNAASAVISTEELRDLCARTIDELDIAGAQIALSVGDDLVFASAGTANVDLGTQVTDDTVFQIGSTTKLYTAVLVLQLADRGLIDIDTPVEHYLPGVKLAAGDEWRSITPRHLMAMISGLDNGPYIETGRGDDCVANYVAGMADIPLVFAPGSAFGYSNASTVVSGLLVERMTGLCWDDALAEFLLRPAGLGEAVSLYAELPYHRIAIGRFPGVDHAARQWTWGRGMGPAGTTLASTARDLARFGRIFLRGGLAEDGTRILSERSVAEMQSPQITVPSQVFAQNWCVGPYRKQWGSTELWGHSGTTQNGSSLLLWIPELDVSIATIVNTPPRGYPFADTVGAAILRDRMGVPKPGRPTFGSFGPIDPTPYLGTYSAHGLSYELTRDGDDLVATMTSTNILDPELTEDPPVRTILRPIAPHRFLPEDDAITRYHTWDISFAIDDDRATLLHNGGFTARRTS
jgi:CubicO group peptidase (beta-lactamase class C family)